MTFLSTDDFPALSIEYENSSFILRALIIVVGYVLENEHMFFMQNWNVIPETLSKGQSVNVDILDHCRTILINF